MDILEKRKIENRKKMMKEDFIEVTPYIKLKSNFAYKKV
jgi:hypothetical protein